MSTDPTSSVFEQMGQEITEAHSVAEARTSVGQGQHGLAQDLESGIVPLRPSPAAPAEGRTSPDVRENVAEKQHVDPQPSSSSIPKDQKSLEDDASETTYRNVEAGIPGQHNSIYCVGVKYEAEQAQPTGKRDPTTWRKLKPSPGTIKFVLAHLTLGFRVSLQSPLMLLLPFVPAGFAINYTIGPSVPSFAVNLVALIPLSRITGDSLGAMELRQGSVFAGFIYITSSNLVQLVSSILLLKSNQLEVLRTNLIGGILSCLLLVLGGAMFLGGWGTMQQEFNVTVSQLTGSCLMLGATSLLAPTASYLLQQTSVPNLVRQSRGISVVLFVVYVCLFFFEFKTHNSNYRQPDWSEEGQEEGQVESRPEPPVEPTMHSITRGQKWAIRASLALPFGLSIALLAFNVAFATDSIASIVEPGHLTPSFIGLILLPILNNDLEPFFLAKADKMDLVVQFTIGKCIQTALFVTPLIVFIAWGQGIPLALSFDGFEVLSLLLSILLLNFIAGPGTSHWMKGIILLGDWAMIAVAAFYAGA